MKLIFHIPAHLRTWTDDRSRVELEGDPADVRAALELLWRRHPGVRDRVVDEQGQVRLHVNVFVDAESIRFTGGLATALDRSCEISIVPAVSGG